MVTDQSLNNNGWPERYFAVIFTAQRSLSGDDIYDITADRMVLLARRQPGFLGVESVGRLFSNGIFSRPGVSPF